MNREEQLHKAVNEYCKQISTSWAVMPTEDVLTEWKEYLVQEVLNVEQDARNMRMES